MSMFKSRGKHARDGKSDAAKAASSDIAEPFDESAGESFESDHLESAEGDTAAGDTQRIAAVSDDTVVSGGPGFTAAFDEIPLKRRRKGLKIFGITFGSLVAVVLAVYLIGAVVFMGRFLPNTKVGDYDVSMMSDGEVVTLLDDIVAKYRLDVLGGTGFSYRLWGHDIGMSIDSPGIVQAMHEDLNAWTWPALIFGSEHDETELLQISFAPELYEGDLVEALAQYNEAAIPPTNATIAYDEVTARFDIKPEIAGTQLDVPTVAVATRESIGDLDSKLQLGEEALIQPTVFQTDEKLIESAELASGMVSAKLTLMLGGQPVQEVDSTTLSAFITMNDQLEVSFNEDELNAWVGSLAGSFNTIDTERTYVRADGKQITVGGGVYGWEIDTEATKNAVLDGIRSGAATQIEIPCVSAAAVYNGTGQRDWGNRYIDVDISEQYVRFYGDDGSIIWEAPCISGSPDGMHNTWQGVWRLNNKESPSKLIGYEYGKKIYETTVTYWMPFEGNGIGFHDATWQPSFGGSMYANGYGSHGCVNLSYSSAQSLYDIISIGDVVVVHS